MIHTVKSFSVVNEAEVNVFLELLNIWKFPVHILLKPSLKDFEHNLACVWNELNCMVVWTFFGLECKLTLFQPCSHCWVFQICWHIECSTFTASSFRTGNSSTGIPSPHKSHLSQWCLHYTSVPLGGGTRGSAASWMDLCNSSSARVTQGQRAGTLKMSGQEREARQKNHTLQDSIYWNAQCRQIHRDRSSLVVAGGRDWGEMGKDG